MQRDSNLTGLTMHIFLFFFSLQYGFPKHQADTQAQRMPRGIVLSGKHRSALDASV